jgi:hypothetical protein
MRNSGSAGIPLTLVGMVAYGLVAAPSMQENGEELLPGFDDLTLLWMATFIADCNCIFYIRSEYQFYKDMLRI